MGDNNAGEAQKMATVAYEHIERDLRARITAGEWQIGAMLPSQRSLAAHYSVGIGTVQHAITNLLHSGILYAEDRRGTFVASIPTGSTSGNQRPIAPIGRSVEALLKHQ
ncbi:MAG TPA: winged helix-turn-helix domain-containing protein [Armatimonadota bacterium]|nr:winged helix-turn-helix domain-containing protein [Armatimonadota bacterium]